MSAKITVYCLFELSDCSELEESLRQKPHNLAENQPMIMKFGRNCLNR